MIRYEKYWKTMNKKGWCCDDFSDAAVPEKLFINFFGLMENVNFIEGLVKRVEIISKWIFE